MSTLFAERLILRPWKESDAKSLFEYAKERMTTIWCGYYDRNYKSKRVQEKAGFVKNYIIKI